MMRMKNLRENKLNQCLIQLEPTCERNRLKKDLSEDEETWRRTQSCTDRQTADNIYEINLPSQGRLQSSNQILVYVPIKLM